MSHKLLNIVILLLVFTACKGPEQTGSGDQNTQTTLTTKPAWVSERPISSAYYIGIGSASKTREPLEYQSVAKKNALNDLSSEIRVVVEGETFLNTLDRNTTFEEEFRAQIKTRVLEDIQDFEIVDSWETPGEYWVYYRLSKAEHERIKREKKDKAMAAAFDLYSKGKAATTAGNFDAGFDMHMRALLELKEYWSEVNPYMMDGQTIYLDNAIYADLRAMGSELHLEPESPEVVLDKNNGFRAGFTVRVMRDGKGVRGIPVSYYYDKGKFMRPKILVTDASGRIVVPVEDVNLDATGLSLSLIIDVKGLLAEDLDKKLTEPLVAGIKADQTQLPVRVEYPRMFISSDERMFGQQGESKRLANALAARLSARGFKMSASAGDADYLVSISANTTEGGTSQGFHVAFLDMNIRITEKSSGDEIFSRAFTKVKGLQLNFGAAGQEAYKKGTQVIEDELAPALIEQIL